MRLTRDGLYYNYFKRMKEIDGFTELCVIGEGAFGKVYKAVDRNNKVVAIKYIKFEGEEEGIPSSALR